MQAPDFKRVFARPQRSVDACFTVLAIEAGQQMARLGLAVSKKQARRAVDRNRLKRLIRECFRHRRHELAGIDIVVLIRAGALGVQNKRLADSLDRHMETLVAKFRRSDDEQKNLQ